MNKITIDKKLGLYKEGKDWKLVSYSAIENGEQVEIVAYESDNLQEGTTYEGELIQKYANTPPRFKMVNIIQSKKEPFDEEKEYKEMGERKVEIITQLEKKGLEKEIQKQYSGTAEPPSTTPKYDKMWAIEQVIQFYQRSSQETISYKDITKTAQVLLDWIKEQ